MKRGNAFNEVIRRGLDPKFWLERWSAGHIPFHQSEYNRWLTKWWPTLDVPKDARAFVPMCGKSLDMRWLEMYGHDVIGIELSDLAVRGYFEDGDESWTETRVDGLISYKGPSTHIYCGDYFDLTAPLLSKVGAVFDRAALVVLPADVRPHYVDHLLRVIPDGSQILLVTLEYDQKLVSGPPFSVLPEEVERLFAPRCLVTQMVSEPIAVTLPHFQAQGVDSAVEGVYRIVKEA